MLARRIAGGRDLTLSERVAGAHHANETVAEQAHRPHLRHPSSAPRRRFPDRRSRRAAPCCPCPASARSAAARPGASAPTRAMRSGPKVSTKPSLVRSVKVRTSLPRLSISAGRRTASASSTSWPTPRAELERPGVGTRPRPALTSNGSPVVCRNRRQRPAHRRRAEAAAFGRARDAAFREQHIQGDEQVEIGPRHWATIL